MNRKNEKIQKLVIASLLCAIGILIPILSPVKIRLDPMSFTLASHVAIIIAMFISPAVAVSVELGTTAGFLLAGFPPVIVLRALVQIFFVVIGAYWLQKRPGSLHNFAGMSIWLLVTGVIHGAAEALAASWFYFSGSMDQSRGFFNTIVILVGFGTLIHHIADFFISFLIWKPVSRIIRIPVSFKFRSKVKAEK